FYFVKPFIAQLSYGCIKKRFVASLINVYETLIKNYNFNLKAYKSFEIEWDDSRQGKRPAFARHSQLFI
ncbi:MAG: hypothetical protein ACKN9I_03720, partial [Alphaproteobacteria bacterium]